MEETQWQDVIVRVNGMIEGDAEVSAIPSDITDLASMLLDAGENNEGTRDNLLVSLKGMLKGYPGYPWVRGNQGALSAAARSVVDSACEEIRVAATDFWNATETYSQPFLRKHGKSKGSPVYGDAAEYANSLASKARKSATVLFKSEQWDGTLAGLADISYPEYTEEE